MEAIENGDPDALCEELGDLLLQIVFHAQLATETGKFTVADVVDALANKMVRRHPHVFGDAVIEDVDAQWRKLGEAQSARKNRTEAQEPARRHSKTARRAAARPAHAGESVARRLRLAGRRRHSRQTRTKNSANSPKRDARSQDDPHVREELGDVFFTLVNLARALGIDAEAAMREANEKFYRRFAFMEERAAADGKALSDLSLENSRNCGN